MGSLDADALARGVTAISAGNHAMAVGTSAKVVMPRNYVDELVLVDDDQLREAMRLLFCHAKLAVEPAGAASTAALLGPLRERLAGKQVAAIVCGSNIDERSFAQLLDQRGPTTDALADPCARQS